MPRHNRFRHQAYPTVPELVPVTQTLGVDDGKTSDFSQLHTGLNYGHVVLVHGTFMGNDSFAIADTLRHMAGSSELLKKTLEALADGVQARGKAIADRFAGEIGNYTEEYRSRFQQLVGDDPAIQFLRPTWSGQNHHLARADLAIRILCLLHELQPRDYQRVLLWGHSHAGNGFAILTNLLANDATSVSRFFAASSFSEKPHWKRAQQILKTHDGPLPFARFTDIVAFGTPVRYGWDTGGCGSLIHVLHHRNFDVGDPWRTKPLFPPQPLTDVTSARYGDWVQAFGIAGTDLVPPMMQDADMAMQQVLEDGLADPEHEIDTRFIPMERVRKACARWKTGTRCHADGWNLLVDYKPSGRKAHLVIPIEEVMLGHGVATASDWLPSHLHLVTQALKRLRAA